MFTTPTTVTTDVATSSNDNLYHTYAKNETESTRGTLVGNSSSSSSSSSESSPAHSETVGSAGAKTSTAPPASSAKDSSSTSHQHGRRRAAASAKDTARGGTGQDNHQVTRPSPLRSVMMAT